ncbi:MAG: CHASE domain-containing protein, partial [bacterium]
MLRHFPFILLVLACVILTIMAFLLVREWEEDRLLTAFNRTAHDRFLALQHKIESTLDHLNSLGAFYAASKEVTREEFHLFVTPVIAKNKTIQALEWIPKVLAEKREAYQLRVREKGHPNFEFLERRQGGGMKRAGKREVYYPVYFVEPLAGNEKAFGFDLGSESTRLAALNEAADTGKMVISGRITLVQETGSQFGFLVFLPIYKKQG